MIYRRLTPTELAGITVTCTCPRTTNFKGHIPSCQVSAVAAAIRDAYIDAAQVCETTAGEHTTNQYSKNELEMVARLLRKIAVGEDID